MQVIVIWMYLAVAALSPSNVDGAGDSGVCRRKYVETPCLVRKGMCGMDESRHRTPANCAEALKHSGRASGIHRIEIPDSRLGAFFVYCLEDPVEGAERAWTVVLRRMDGKVDFDRTWKEYMSGFGDMNRDFILGLDKIHALTQSALHELWIDMKDFENERRSANYTSFAIGSEIEKYAITMVGDYSGNAGDSLIQHVGMKFSTKDSDNDISSYSCSRIYRTAWWYINCYYCQLTGKYLRGKYGKEQRAQGITWWSWHGIQYSMKYVHMAIRPAL